VEFLKLSAIIPPQLEQEPRW